MLWFRALVVAVATLRAGTQGARVRGVEVPQEARAGEDVSLRCLVDPWPDPLYSLAWWKDGEQIYRVAVVPAPPGDPHALPVRSMVTVFSLPGLSVKSVGPNKYADFAPPTPLPDVIVSMLLSYQMST
ncbi:uncharacterized protein LOC134764184 [Penaeus indicus]|uniref:uncharacterized protein LOC134764184 n=1 Tax=Penaeus indicus TaxID=29960 RepID=UPI00300CB5AA